MSTYEQQKVEQVVYSTAVPHQYLDASNHPGKVIEFQYPSCDYARDNSEIIKVAYVYLPYGYDENNPHTPYNICYFMHGWGGHAGEYFELAQIKEMLDHMIEHGDIPPMIVVSATFDRDNQPQDFGISMKELRQFYQDFTHHLMPAVEGHYHTYAKSTSEEDLKASRDHRAFGGFSLGAITTWLQFCHNTDYIRYFLPMSGSCWYYGGFGDFQIEKNVAWIKQIVEKNRLEERGYFIYHGVGTHDSVKGQSIMMAKEMLSEKYEKVFTPDHYRFYQRRYGQHDFYSVREFMYNALPLFFKV